MKVIEFFGMPRAGKTTAIELVESYLKKEGANIRLVYEGARVSPLDKKDRYNYNAWSFHNTVNRILEARLDHYDFILVDRGVLDHLAFTGSLSCEEHSMENTTRYYSEFLGLQDQEIYFTVKPEEAIRREKKHKPFLGRVFDKGFLENLIRSYEKTVYDAKEQGRDIIEVDGNLDFETNMHKMLEYAKNL